CGAWCDPSANRMCPYRRRAPTHPSRTSRAARRCRRRSSAETARRRASHRELLPCPISSYTSVTRPASIPASVDLPWSGSPGRLHVLGAAHHRAQDLVVVGAAAQVAGNAVRQFGARGVRVGLEETYRRHHEAGHAERALESLLV